MNHDSATTNSNGRRETAPEDPHHQNVGGGGGGGGIFEHLGYTNDGRWARVRELKKKIERTVYGRGHRTEDVKERFGTSGEIKQHKGDEGEVLEPFSRKWWYHSLKIEGRRLLAELHGTFLLTLAQAGVRILAVRRAPRLNDTAIGLTDGLIYVAVIYQLGQVSGVHLNPIVTLAFAARGLFSWWRVPFYWLVQFAGATIAAVLLYGFWGKIAYLGATFPRYNEAQAFGAEAIGTYALITTYLATVLRYNVLGPNTALAIGAAFASLSLFLFPISGASFNPARSFGPAVIAGQRAWDSYWVYVVGPLTGAFVAVLIERMLASHYKAAAKSAKKAATGLGHITG